MSIADVHGEPEIKFRDVYRTCRECGRAYVVHAGEVRFFLRKELPLPVRCAFCRKAHRLTRGAGSEARRHQGPRERTT